MSNKPWEVLVGQTIARVAKNGGGVAGEHGMTAYLGEKVCRHLLEIESSADGGGGSLAEIIGVDGISGESNFIAAGEEGGLPANDTTA